MKAIIVSGFSGVGKDEFVSQLKKLGVDGPTIGLSDVMKRHMMDLFGFSAEQMFGPSKFRNEPDGKTGVVPRTPLQKYGELMNEIYLKGWIGKCIENMRKFGTGKYTYTREEGLKEKSLLKKVLDFIFPPKDVYVFCADCRHIHEFEEFKKAGKDFILVRIKSDRVPEPPYAHRSETEQVRIPDSEFDFVIENSGSLLDLRFKAEEFVKAIKSR